MMPVRILVLCSICPKPSCTLTLKIGSSTVMIWPGQTYPCISINRSHAAREQNTGIAVKIVMGDFNSLKMDSHLPHYKQFVTFPTRDDKILDMLHCNIKDSYLAYKKAPLGASDHNMIHLLPKYGQIIKCKKPTEVHVTKWSTERVEVLWAALT